MVPRLVFIFCLALVIHSASAQTCVCDDWFYNLTATASAQDEKSRSENLFDVPFMKEVMDYRLTESVKPIHYDLQIQSFWVFGEPVFIGEVTAWFKYTKEVVNITLHTCKLRIDDVELFSVSGDNAPKIINVTEDEVREFLVIHLDKPLKANQIYKIRINFTGDHNLINFNGFVARKYEENGITKYMVVTHFEPVQARRTFPCFDEPQLKATFNISIVRPENITSLSNMPLLESIKREDGWFEDRFQESPKMSTYTLAFAICDFDYVEAYAGDTLIRIWVRPAVINETKLAITLTPLMVTFLENYLEIPYSLPKLDLIAVPGVMYGAMENWGLVTFDEKNLLYDGDNDESNFTVISFLAHEIAHQWFGNLVTMKWWNDIWLNEGLTTYISDVVYKEVIKPKEGWYDFYVCGRFFELVGWETNPGAHPLSFGLLSSVQIRQVFTRITYAKGAMMTRMMTDFGSNDIIRRSLKRYLLAHQFSNADQDDLWHHFAEEIKSEGIDDVDIKEIMDSWTLQMGIPVLTVTRNYTTQTAYIRQKNFQPSIVKTTNNMKNDTKWLIPLAFITKSSENIVGKPMKWLHPKDDHVLLTADHGIPNSADWIIFNPTLTGYYLVNYDNRNWKLLINQLMKDHTKIPPHLRMHLLYSLQIFKNNNLVSQNLAYSALEYYRKEKIDWILFGGLQELVELNRNFQQTPHHYLFKQYLRYLIKPIWRNLWTDVEATYADSIFRSLEQLAYKLSCACGNKECLKKVRETLQVMDITDESYWQQNRFVVNDDTLCSVFRKMSDSEWEELWTDLMMNTNYTLRAASRNAYLKSFTCTSNPALLNKALTAAFNFDDTNFDLTENERLSLFYGSLTAGYFHRQIAMSIFKDHWPDILQKSNETFIYLEILSSTINTHNEVHEVTQIITCLPAEFVAGKEERYRRIVSRMQNHVDQFQTSLAVDYKWLQQVTENLDPIFNNEDSF